MIFNRNRYRLFIFFLVLYSNNVNSQDFFEEFDNLINTEKPSLLPEKMLITQRILWGEKGLFRKTGIAKLSIENREKELIIREKNAKSSSNYWIYNFCWDDLPRYIGR